MKKFLVVLFVMVASCTDSSCAKMDALGSSAKVKCYSGDKIIYEGGSTGVIESPTNSDGYQFMEQESGKLVEVSGNCVIKY